MKYLVFDTFTGESSWQDCKVLSDKMSDPKGVVKGYGYMIEWDKHTFWTHETRIKEQKDDGKSSRKPVKGKERTV